MSKVFLASKQELRVEQVRSLEPEAHQKQLKLVCGFPAVQSEQLSANAEQLYKVTAKKKREECQLYGFKRSGWCLYGHTMT